MNFLTLNKEINSIIKDNKDNISLVIKTAEGVIEINPNVAKSAASVIKIPIAMACLKTVEKEEIDINKKIKITNPVAGTGVINYSSNIDSISLKDAIILSIIVSDNTAANIIIDIVGIERINCFFKDIGAKNTKLSRKFMDQESIINGKDNITTANDMSLFLENLSNSNDYLSKKSKNLLINSMRNQQFRDKLPSYQNMFNNNVEIGNKTGTLNKIEHDVAYFKKELNLILVTILSSGWEYNHNGQQMISHIGKKILKYME